MVEHIFAFIDLVIVVVQGLAAVIVAYGALVALHAVVMKRSGRAMTDEAYAWARISLGRRLVIGLEFLLGADILRTVTFPTWNQIGVVGAIIILRSALNLLLEHDINRLEREVAHD